MIICILKKILPFLPYSLHLCYHLLNVSYISTALRLISRYVNNVSNKWVFGLWNNDCAISVSGWLKSFLLCLDLVALNRNRKTGESTLLFCYNLDSLLRHQNSHCNFFLLLEFFFLWLSSSHDCDSLQVMTTERSCHISKEKPLI